MFILGMDIGYSNLKLAFGESGRKPETALFPAGAAPEDYVSKSILASHSKGGFEVKVGGETYVAGIDQSSIDGWTRVLSSEYPFSDDYKALFHAALMVTEKSEIDMLVTGLPVEQSVSDEFKAKLIDHLTGQHEISEGRFVTVKRVKVIPQPVGAFIDYLMTVDDPRIVQASRVLVIDPGFFSVDWCAIDKGNFDKSSSDSSQDAMSVLLEEAGRLLTADTGRPFDLATLEDAARGDRLVPVFGEMKDLNLYLDLAAGNVSENVMKAVRQKMRRSKIQGADFILLAGGGAEHYKDAASKIMEGSKVVTGEEPVLANARGFFQLGKGNQ
ncbi:ParM/StbA family protein [Marinobacter alkaliphilus]|uniref:ParM/StbA family protein n=1 Tax=Marinobacter alkaliphilus TaxID=254719 RepID=A0ABZ3EAM2_9GAMM